MSYTYVFKFTTSKRLHPMLEAEIQEQLEDTIRGMDRVTEDSVPDLTFAVEMDLI